MASAPAPLREITAACRRDALWVVVISFFLNLLILTLPIYLLQVYTRVIPSRSVDTLVYLTAAAVGSFVVFGVLFSIRMRILVRVGQKIDGLLGERVLSALIVRAVHPLTATEVPGLRDLATLRSFVGGNEIVGVLDAPWTPIFVAAVYVLHPTLGLITLAGVLLLVAVALLNEALTRKPLAEASASEIAAQNDIDANLRNAEAIDAMGMRPGVVRRWMAENGRSLRAQRLAGDRSALLAGASRAVRFGLQAAILCVAAFLVLDQTLNPGVMIVAVILMGRAVAPVEQAIGTWRRLIAARGAWRRLDQLLGNAASIRTTHMALPAPRGALRAEYVTFSFPGATRPLLHNIAFALDAGETLGIVGPTAVGKSTLAKLLVGIWRPHAGHVRLDGADVATWNSDELGRYIGYLPQDVELFDGTVRDNIARLSDAEPAQVVTAASMAGVHEMILRLPDGYETRVGRGGIALSGGQRQRIALARAFFGAPRLIVLDEPNASLDNDGELALREAVRLARSQLITVVIIAHRPSILADVDKLLYLRNGRVEEFGAREEVMAKLAPQARQPRVVNLQTRDG
jgi:PrtD family type I secretion system ABC transporter